MGNPKLSDELAQQALDLYTKHGNSPTRAAREIGIPVRTMENRIKVARDRGMHLSPGARRAMDQAGLNGAEARGGWLHEYDADGKKIATTNWRAPEEEPEDIADRMAERMNAVLAAPKIKRPKGCSADVLNFVPVFDVHLGQRTGTFGTAAAVDRLIAGFQDVINRAPKAHTTIILNGGDYTEANDNNAQTPQSKHPLSVDTDFDTLMDIAVDTKIHLIEYALQHSERVIYQPLKGNHDPATAPALRAGLRQRYRKNSRFEMPEGHDVFAHQWEGNFIAGIHGDQKVSNPQELTLAIAARHAAAWGSAKRRELWRGHLHKETTINVPGMRVYQVNPICPPGRYANANLFTGESDIQCVTYRKGGGRAATTVHIFDDLE